MTTYLRSDVPQVQAAHIHKRKGDPFVLDCPECEAQIRLQPGIWADRPSLIPLTEDEQHEQEQVDRDVALANAAQGRAIRQEQTTKARAARGARKSL